MKESPDYVRLSLAAAMTLDLKPGLFYRDARLYCINLLLTYADGCTANCAYCGLSRQRPGTPGKRSFIRVSWPTYPTSEVVARMSAREDRIRRICISMVTRRRAVADTVTIAEEIRAATHTPISCLISPTVTDKDDLLLMKRAGVDKVGIAIDAVTEASFDELRGSGVGGPHRWQRYWECLAEALEVFGDGNAGSHFIVGLGETEREILACIQRTRDLGGRTHLFSFFPEHESLLSDRQPPPISTYRRVQLGRWLVDGGLTRLERMTFDGHDRVTDFGVEVEEFLDSGEPFMTSGCSGNDGTVACNRPFANERPGEEIRNYPFHPEPEDLKPIRDSLWTYTMS